MRRGGDEGRRGERRSRQEEMEMDGEGRGVSAGDLSLRSMTVHMEVAVSRSSLFTAWIYAGGCFTMRRFGLLRC